MQPIYQAQTQSQDPSTDWTAGVARLGVGRLFDAALESWRRRFDTEALERGARVAERIGGGGLGLAAVLALALYALAATLSRDPIPLFYGVVSALGLLLLRYMAGRFAGAWRRLLRGPEIHFSSSAVTDCLALLAAAAGVAGFLALLALAARGGVVEPLLPGAAWCALGLALASIAIQYRALGVQVKPGVPATAEAAGLLVLLHRAATRLLPFAFAVGVLLGTARLLLAAAYLIPQVGGVDLGAALAGVESALLVLVLAGLLPFLGNLALLLAHLGLTLLCHLLEGSRRNARLG